MAEPFIKWVGGKRELAPEIISRLRMPGRCYYEPFLGGGAVFFALDKLAIEAGEPSFTRMVLGDSCEPLVRTWRAVAADLRDFDDDSIEKIVNTRGVVEETFAMVRDEGFEQHEDFEVAWRFLYLNKTCFNGLWRVNGDGRFNTSWGKKPKSFRPLEPGSLFACAKAIERAHAVIRCADFEDLLRTAGRGDSAYLDPPFFPAGESSDFTGYSAGGFGQADQERVERVARAAADRGCCVVLSNADVPLARELYSLARGWKIDAVLARRAVNSDASKRGPVGEILVTEKRMEQISLTGD